ncbi:MAG: spermidine/putrescine ABC transporter substrate-binding protein [Clostridia bacterium]
MKRAFCLMLLGIMFFAAPASATKLTAGEAARARAQALSEEERQVNVFTWTYYIPDEVVAEFEEASGIRVNYSAMMGNEDVLPKLTTGGAYDLVVCSDYIISDLVAMSQIRKLDKAKLSNYANINPVYQSQYYDPENLYTVPYTNTVPLIVYDPDAVDFEVKGYADLWRSEFEGNLALIAEWRGVIGIAQKKLGYSYNDTDPAHIAQVGEALKALKGNIAVMNDDTPHSALIYGDAIAGFMYGSQIVAAQQVLPQLKVVYPDEGLGFGVDSMVIPEAAPHAEAAYILLDYLLDGEVSAYTSELINYGNCNVDAKAYMTPEFLANGTVNIPEKWLTNTEMIKPLDGATLAAYDKIWTAFMQ